MDCRQTQEALAAARGGSAAFGVGAGAAEHTASCPECAAFSAALAALGAIGSPIAPDGLAERITGAIASEAALMDQEALAVQASSLVPGVVTPTAGSAAPGEATPAYEGTRIPPWLTRTRLWAATGAITLAAASVGVVIIISGRADQAALRQVAEDAARSSAAPNAEVAGAPGAAAPGVVAPIAPAKVPDYVAYQAFAYVAGAANEATPSQATTVGTTQTALRTGTAQTVSVLQTPGSGRSLLLALPTGEYRALTAVTRSLGTRAFQLRSGPSLDRFGAWPGLPQGYAQPMNADGSPYYRAAGRDTLGVAVYVRVGETPEMGFGIAPGTTATDPAAGNPNWTWWSPIQ
jgi:hypothetical protein